MNPRHFKIGQSVILQQGTLSPESLTSWDSVLRAFLSPMRPGAVIFTPLVVTSRTYASSATVACAAFTPPVATKTDDKDDAETQPPSATTSRGSGTSSSNGDELQIKANSRGIVNRAHSPL